MPVPPSISGASFYQRHVLLSKTPFDQNIADTDIDGLAIAVSASSHEKCVRCWHFREDVGSHQEHPELCGRCVDNIEGDGEVRHFA